MKREHEHKIDNLIRSLLKENKLQEPPSNNFTPTLLIKLAALDARRRKIRAVRQLVLSITVAILMSSGIIIGLNHLWQTGQLKIVIDSFSQLKMALPVKIPLSVLALVVLHTIAVRALALIYFYNQRHSRMI